MAWNGSDGRHAAAEATPRPVASPPSRVRGLVAALVVVVLAAGAFFFLFRKGGGPEPESPAPSRPAAAKPEAATVADTPKKAVESPTKDEKVLAEIKYLEDKYGTNMPPGVKTHVYFLKNPPKKHFKIKGRFDYLRHPAERQIASLVSVEPGTFILSPPEFGESFNKDFLNALLDKTEILPDDDDETRAIKELVEETKRQMAEIQRKEGKLPSEILTEHAAVLYELGQAEKSLEDELAKIRDNPEASDQDVEDLFRAANKIRAAKGLPERVVPDFSKRSIRLQRRLARRKAREGK